MYDSSPFSQTFTTSCQLVTSTRSLLIMSIHCSEAPHGFSSSLGVCTPEVASGSDGQDSATRGLATAIAFASAKNRQHVKDVNAIFGISSFGISSFLLQALKLMNKGQEAKYLSTVVHGF